MDKRVTNTLWGIRQTCWMYIGVTVGFGFVLFLLAARGQESASFSCPKRQVLGLGVPATSSYCKFNYTVRNWEGRDIMVCDENICKGRERLEVLPHPGTKQPRWSKANEEAYLDLYRSNKIEGWLLVDHIHWVRELTMMQHNMGIYGTVGEIGVHHGKFFMPIAGYASVSEPAVAMDLFESQEENFDQSGQGNKGILLRHLETVGIPHNSSLHLLGGNSMYLTAANISSKGIPAFRLLSVDGGHSLETTLHDMMLASCLLADGGIMILDDVAHQEWLGVAEAMFHFAFAQSRLVPLMLGSNKAYFATASHAKQYKQYVISRKDVFKCKDLHPSRHAIDGVEFCKAGNYLGGH